MEYGKYHMFKNKAKTTAIPPQTAPPKFFTLKKNADKTISRCDVRFEILLFSVNSGSLKKIAEIHIINIKTDAETNAKTYKNILLVFSAEI